MVRAVYGGSLATGPGRGVKINQTERRKTVSQIRDVNVQSITSFESPERYLERLPSTREIEDFVLGARQQIIDILTGQDLRLLCIVGPCSIHDDKAGLEYASKLVEPSRKIASRIFVVIRAYFQKPRTTLGWKGLISDPDLNGTFDMGSGLYRARALLLEIVRMGLPVATELLDPFTPQYIDDLISWAAIGARTVESQTHRQMASGLSMPVGFKNGTSGNVQVAVDAITAAQSPHSFFGIDRKGRAAIVATKGNPYNHLVLRGGESGPNYGVDSIADALSRLKAAGLGSRLIVDCSHDNSQKIIERQAVIFREVLKQRLSGNRGIVGLMLESNLFPGKQSLNENGLDDLQYGVSLTDPCIGWDQTVELLTEAYESLDRAATIRG